MAGLVWLVFGNIAGRRAQDRLCSVVLHDGWPRAGLCSVVLQDGWLVFCSIAEWLACVQ